uniref:Uncharacterized protein n=1 Tax=Rhizophora mucronata TaxID=61149 RepID=A0A2P2PZL8_RHIMU
MTIVNVYFSLCCCNIGNYAEDSMMGKEKSAKLQSLCVYIF